jgi:lipopolysaccharide cholinephosphotransferase
VKHPRSLFQDLQAILITLLRLNIVVQQGYSEPQSIKSKIACKFMSVINVRSSFALLNRIMTIWNRKETKYYVNLGSRYGHRKQTIPKSKYYPPKKVDFEGGFYNAPNDWDYILTRIYGDYMKLPPVEKRVTHSPVRIEFGDEKR